jgi:histidinol-phosphate aminotransferase
VASALVRTDGITPYPSGANFVLFHVDRGDAGALWQALVDRKVLVRDFSRWPGVEQCLRVTIGTPEENDSFLDVLTDALAEVQS